MLGERTSSPSITHWLMPSAPSRPMLIPLIVACGLFMENLDSTVLSTALPAIARSLEENPLHLSLAMTAYLFSLAVFIPISGWVADRFGARTVFRAAIVIFTIGSILCGISDSLPQFVLARVFQGFGGAMMVPVGRLVLLRAVPKSELVRAMAWLTVPALIGPVLGPPVGGFITTYLSWRWIFWINVPIGLLGIVLVTLFIEDVREERQPPFDWVGFALLGLALTGLVGGFETVARGFLPDVLVAALFAAGAILLTLYIFHARRRPHAVLDLTLLRIPTFRASIVGGFLFRMGIGATPFLLPLMLQIGFGLTPFESGTLTFVSAVGALLMKTTAGPILRRFGFRRVLIGNAVVGGALLATYGLFEATTPHWIILAVLIVSGYFRSLQFTSVNTIAYADMPRERMSRATSFASVCQQLSLSVGIGTGALLLHLTVTARGDTHLAAMDFAPAFFALGLLSALSCLVHLQLRPDAGAEVSGHVARPRTTGSARTQPGE
jgi:EmrB/QacA subfamily drug resistance transporter